MEPYRQHLYRRLKRVLKWTWLFFHLFRFSAHIFPHTCLWMMPLYFKHCLLFTILDVRSLDPNVIAHRNLQALVYHFWAIMGIVTNEVWMIKDCRWTFLFYAHLFRLFFSLVCVWFYSVFGLPFIYTAFQYCLLDLVWFFVGTVWMCAMNTRWTNESISTFFYA